MKCLVIIYTLIAIGASFSTQVNAQDHWYWHMEPGNEKYFRNVADQYDRVYMYVDGEGMGGTIWRFRWTIFDVVQEESAIAFSVDPDGSVWILAWYEPVNIPDAPVLFVEAPLVLGQSWEQWIMWGSLVHHVNTVIAEDDVTVPYGDGTYHCHELMSEVWVGDLLYQWFDVWYHDGVGMVKYQAYNIVGWGDGIYELYDGVIPVEQHTWGAVKNLYR
jgi:hypothetical protein